MSLSRTRRLPFLALSRHGVCAAECPLLGGKADMTGCGCLLSRSLLGVKRTSLFAAHMSAYDPKRTSGCPHTRPLPVCSFDAIRCPVLSLTGAHAAARVHHGSRRRNRLANCCAWAAGERMRQIGVLTGSRAE